MTHMDSGGIFGGFFESAEQTITSGGTLTIAHGLGGAPKGVGGLLVCKTATVGFSVGDKFFISPASVEGSDHRNVRIDHDATNLVIDFGLAAKVFIVLDKINGSQALLTNTQWKAIFRAWR